MSMIRGLVLVVALASMAGGCGPSKPAMDSGAPGLGPDLHEVGKTTGTRLEYKADRDGTLYLYDYSSGQFLLRLPVNSKETFVFEPDSSRAMLGKQPVDLDVTANPFDEYRLYMADRLPQ